MNKLNACLVVLVSSIVAGGCSQSSTPGAGASKLEAQVLELKEQQAGLLKTIDQLTQQREGEMKVIVERLVDARIKELIEQKVEAAIVQKVGSHQEIEEVFQSTVQEQLALFEQQKKKKEEDARQKQREEWDKRRQEESDKRFAALAQELKLNDAQKAQLQTMQQDIRTQVRTMFEKMREDGNFNFDNIRKEVDALREQHTAQSQTFMSAEQAQAYQDKIGGLFRMMGWDQGRGRGGPGGGAAPGER